MLIFIGLFYNSKLKIKLLLNSVKKYFVLPALYFNY